MLPGDDSRLLLVIDQFEELFHQVGDGSVRSRFVRNIVEAVDDPSIRLTVLITLRADYFDRALEQPPLGERIAAHTVNGLPLRAHELEAAAVLPAEQAGTHVEPELLADLVGDMTRQPGALPLCQYVLTELFAARNGPMLTRASYRELGGLSGALSSRAEDTYEALEPEVRPVVRQVFMRLVTVGSGSDDSRRRVERSSLEALHPGVKVVLDAFDEARLLTFDRNPQTGASTVEVAHEALLREWPRLSGWLNAARDDLRLYGTLMSAAAGWEASERDSDYLLAGSRLALYDDWKTDAGITLTDTEEEFLATSVRRRAAEEQREDARRQEELTLKRRSVRRLRWLVAVVSVAAIVAAGLTLFALNRNREAVANERVARARELANAAIVNAEADPELGILLALEAIEVTRAADGSTVREAEEALHVAVNAHRVVGSVQGAGGVEFQYDVKFHPDGGLLVGGDWSRLIDPIGGDTVFELPTRNGDEECYTVAVASDARVLATGCAPRGHVALWDGDSGAEIAELGVMNSAVGGLDITSDGRFVAALAPGPGRIQVWDVASGEVIAQRADPGAYIPHGPKLQIAMDPFGNRLAVTMGNDVKILDVDSGEWMTDLVGHGSLTTSVDFIDEATVVSGAMDGTVRIWDAGSGVERAVIDARVGQIVSLAVSDDGWWLLAGGDGGAVGLWKLQSGEASPVASLQGMRSMVAGLAFNRSATLGAGVGKGGEVVTWDISSAGLGELASWSATGPIAFSDDGERLAVGDANGRGVVVMTTNDWSPVQHLPDVVPYLGDRAPSHGDEWGLLGGLDFGPGGEVIATTTHGWDVVPGAAAVWDVNTGARIAELGTSPNFRGPVRFSGDGTRLASANCGWPAARAWDVASGDVLLTAPLSGCGFSVGLDHSGQLLALQGILDDEPFVHVWDVISEELVMEATHQPNWTGAAEFGPSGERLLTAGAEGSLRVWDVETGGLVMLLEGHTGPVEGAGWSEDGSLIFSAGLDGTARIWDATTGAMVLKLSGLDEFPYVAMSPDGRWLATSSGGTAKIWALDVEELIDIARRRLTRTFRDAECVTYHFDVCPP